MSCTWLRLPLSCAMLLAAALLPACAPDPDPPPVDAEPSASALCTADEPTPSPSSPYAKELYLRGTMNSWMADAGFGFRATGNKVLTLGVLLPRDMDEFKIADKDWSSELNFGGKDSNLVQLGVPTTLHSGGANVSLQLARDGLYCFKLDARDPENPLVTVSLLKEMEFKEGLTLAKAHAYFLSAEALAWKTMGDAAQFSYFLYHDPAGGIVAKDGALQGGQAIALRYAGPLSGDAKLAAAFPYLAKYVKLTAPELAGKLPDLLREQLVLVVKSADGSVRAATSLQTFGVIDELATYKGDDLGGTFNELGVPTVKLWAPTARAVKLLLYDSATAAVPVQTVDLVRGDKGVWSVQGEPAWKNRFYLYEVEVFARSKGVFVKNLVTDPYSTSLALNSTRSQLVDLNDAALKPAGWDTLKKPELQAFEDIVLYELHVRDFSINDPTVPAAHRGTYLAFTDTASSGMTHLQKLAQAGLSHLHLMPLADFTTVQEDRTQQVVPQIPGGAAPDSEDQQAALALAKGRDAFDWGYDPFHYSAPEGSYAMEANGSARILEVRKMVQSLAQVGLRVVMDVVYNHTHSAGQDDPTSVLDRVVPDYYYRLDSSGAVQNSSCCADTASEHAMMEKLMVDSLRLWARQYKVDGFRFDFMGHHTTANLQHVREALAALTPEKDGVDGKKIYLYGEAWRFGSLVDILPDQAFDQGHAYGSGVGSFNDRIRDSIRGGGPFSGLSDQGFATGLSDDYNQNPANEETPTDLAGRLRKLAGLGDDILLGLAGNLRDYVFIGADGRPVKGADVKYRGAPGAGYTADPQETINYFSAHDNHTFWDYIQAKAPFQSPGRLPQTATLAERVRMQNLALSLVALAQGVPFFLAGEDLLRSKSGDGDSYKSGDWFNRLDLSYATNNWGVGLPPATKNRDQWPLWKPRLAAPELLPTREHILSSALHFRELLQIRRSSPLFRLRSADDIKKRVTFFNVGDKQVPGLVAMSLSNKLAGEPDLDPERHRILVLVNANKADTVFQSDELKGTLTLHPVQKLSADPVVKAAQCGDGSGKLTIPGRTTLVCVENKGP